MSALGIYFCACSLLVAAGFAKAFRPDDTARAMHDQLRLRSFESSRWVVRLLAIGEAALGLGALVYVARPLAAAVAISYGAFSVYVMVIRARGGQLATCGCFGKADTPPTLLHVLTDLGMCVAAVVVALAGHFGALPQVLQRQSGHGIPLVIWSALLTYLAYQALVLLPRLWSSNKRALAKAPQTVGR